MVHTDRVSPPGTAFDNGYQSQIAFAADADLDFWEEAVGAPGMDGGDPIPTTTQQNSALRTFAPGALITLTPFQVQGRFGSGTVDQVYALINQNGWITINWPDGTEFSFVGYLKSFQPGQAQEGQPLQGVIEIVPTNQLSGVETAYSLAEQGSA